MDKIVFETLQRDHAAREIHPERLGAAAADENDLYTLSNIKPNEWDYSLPTLTKGSANKLKTNKIEEFKDNWLNIIPFYVSDPNMLYAGGVVSTALISTYGIYHGDVDIFTHGLPEDEAGPHMFKYIRQLRDAYVRYLTDKYIASLSKSSGSEKQNTRDACANYKPDFDFELIRNKGCVTVKFDRYTFQFILRIYANKSEILHGFDLGSSAVGFDGTSVYFTGLSKFAYEYSCNILDTTRRSTTYEQRLIKYFARNFDIILPYFATQKLRTVNMKYGLADVCEMPYWTFSYSAVQGNKICIAKFLAPDPVHASDYQLDKLSEFEIFFINLHGMVWAHKMPHEPDYYFFTDKIDDIDNMKPFLSRRKIIDYYDAFANKIRIRDRAGVGKDISIRMLRRYMSNTGAILQALIEKSDNNETFNVLLGQGIQEEKARVLAIADGLLARDYPLVWITKNPGSQTSITSSFNPIIEAPEKWYGAQYYTAMPCVGLSQITNQGPASSSTTAQPIDDDTDD